MVVQEIITKNISRYKICDHTYYLPKDRKFYETY